MSKNRRDGAVVAAMVAVNIVVFALVTNTARADPDEAPCNVAGNCRCIMPADPALDGVCSRNGAYPEDPCTKQSDCKADET